MPHADWRLRVCLWGGCYQRQIMQNCACLLARSPLEKALEKVLYLLLLLLLLSPTAGGQADVPAGEGSCIPRGRGAFGGRSRPSPWQGVIGAFSSSPFSPRHHGSASLCETLGRTKKWSRDRDQGPLVLQLPTYTQLLHDLEACRAVSP